MEWLRRERAQTCHPRASQVRGSETGSESAANERELGKLGMMGGSSSIFEGIECLS